jgi:3D (Asp-Asp-Asp) domain-containing protein
MFLNEALLCFTLFVGTVTPTAYQSVPAQTDSSPHFTATGERTNVHGCAVSRDLLRKNGGPLDYGDLIYLEGVGFKFVNDTMNARHRNRVDVWVESQSGESQFYKKWKGKSIRVWKVSPYVKQ